MNMELCILNRVDKIRRADIFMLENKTISPLISQPANHHQSNMRPRATRETKVHFEDLLLVLTKDVRWYQVYTVSENKSITKIRIIVKTTSSVPP